MRPFVGMELKLLKWNHHTMRTIKSEWRSLLIASPFQLLLSVEWLTRREFFNWHRVSPVLDTSSIIMRQMMETAGSKRRNFDENSPSRKRCSCLGKCSIRMESMWAQCPQGCCPGDSRHVSIQCCYSNALNNDQFPGQAVTFCSSCLLSEIIQ